MKYFFTCILLLLISNTNAQKITSKVELEKGVILFATIEKFIPRQHRYDTCTTQFNWKMICLIDGKIWFGTDDGMGLPKYKLKSLTLTINGRKIPLDVTGMYNPSFDGYLSKRQIELVKDNAGYLLYGFFSDGAGTYTAHWRIVKNKSMRLKISRDERDFFWQTD